MYGLRLLKENKLSPFLTKGVRTLWGLVRVQDLKFWSRIRAGFRFKANTSSHLTDRSPIRRVRCEETDVGKSICFLDVSMDVVKSAII